MKKFNFRLQPVHDLREARSERAEAEFAAAAARVRTAADGVEEVRREHERLGRELAHSLGAGEIDPRLAELSFDYLAALERRAREATARLRELEAERERLRLAAAEAGQEAEATARLRERERERHERTVRLAEQSLLDEMAALAQARGTAGGEA